MEILFSSLLPSASSISCQKPIVDFVYVHCNGDGERLSRQYTVTRYTSDNVLAADLALHSPKKRVFGGSQYTWSVSSRPSNQIANIHALHIIITVMAYGNKETPYR